VGRRNQKDYTPGGVLFRNGLIQRVMAHQRFVNMHAANLPARR